MKLPPYAKRNAKFNFSGEESDVSSTLRTYSADSVLKKINREATKIFQSESEIKGVERVRLSMINANTKSPTSFGVYIQAWGLIDLAYYEIRFSNDYRGQHLNTDKELYALAVTVENYKRHHESGLLSEIKASESKLLYYVFGFVGEQFKHQAIETSFDILYRELYILLEIGKMIPRPIDVGTLFYEMTGLQWQTVISVLHILLTGFQKYDTLADILDNIECESVERKEYIVDIAKRYSASYETIRATPLKRQIFYSKPFVRTQHNEIVSISPYLNLSIMEQCVQWTVRDGLRERGNRPEVFTSFFGKCFEEYFHQLLTDCLKPDEYRRIDEKHEKRADWEICIGQTKMIEEQKSSLLSLMAKQ